jgi:steroid 5-alpha reductase family enzyme
MIETIVQIITTNLIAILAFFFVAWIISLITKDASIADVFWGLGFILVSVLTFIIVWLTGFIFETVADIQLYKFIHNPANAGKVMNQGLWYYSRHPNYFGESLMWWGIFIIALPVPYGIITIISPIWITYMLLKVSGVTLLESSLKEKRPEYVDYIKTTSAFIPLPKKKLE